MSMIPFFPSLKPLAANRIWFDSAPTNEEAEILKYEREHHAWLESMKNCCSDLQPLGKVLTMIGVETDDEANDDSEDTDSHEDEDDDTNDRALAGMPDRSALGLYSPGDDMNINEDNAAIQRS